MYATSHLFFLGDLNFRVAIPPSHPLRAASHGEEALSMLTDEKTREALKEYDQLINERRNGRVFVGLREGPFWTFKCTYKYVLGEVDKYKYAVFLLSLSSLLRTKVIFHYSVRAERRHGRTGSCTRLTRTRPVHWISRTLLTFCTRLFLHISPRIM